jgi:hypothetical protein
MEDLNSKQKLYFERIYNFLMSKGEPTSDRRILLPIIINFMRTSGLPDAKLKEAWRLSCPVSEPVSKAQLFSILRYITLGQNGYEIKPSSLPSVGQLGLPEFTDLPFSVADIEKADLTANSTHHGGDNSNAVHEQNYQLLLANLANYKNHIASLLHAPPPFVVTHKNAIEFFSNFNMQHKELSFVWNLCDVGTKGFISEPEIILALHLIRLFKGGKQFPTTLPICYSKFIERYLVSGIQAPSPIQKSTSLRSNTIVNLGNAKHESMSSSFNDELSPKIEPHAIPQSKRNIDFMSQPHNQSQGQNPRQLAPQSDMRSSNIFFNANTSINNTFDSEKEHSFNSQKNQGHTTPHSQKISHVLSEKTSERKPVIILTETQAISSPKIPLGVTEPLSSSSNTHWSEPSQILSTLLDRLEDSSSKNSSYNDQFSQQINSLAEEQETLLSAIGQLSKQIFSNIQIFSAKNEKLSLSLSRVPPTEIENAKSNIKEMIDQLQIPSSVQLAVDRLLQISEENAPLPQKEISQKAGPVEGHSRQKMETPENGTQETRAFEKEQSKFEIDEQQDKAPLFDPNFDFDTLGAPEKGDSKIFNTFISEHDFKDPFAEETQEKKHFEDDFNF